MVGKDEELGDVDDENLVRVKLISEKKRQLDETAEQVCKEIKSSFDRLADALRGREKQLLRQVEAIHRQQLRLVQSDSELLPTAPPSTLVDADLQAEKQLIEQLSSFGKIDLPNSVSVDAEPYKVEEYQEAAKDHVSFDKSLKNEAEEFDVSSVIRRTKRDSYNGNPAKAININLNCTSCESCKFEASPSSALTTARMKLDDGLSAPSTSNSSSDGSSSYEKSLLKESEDDAATSAETESPSANATSVHSENFYFETESSKSSNSSTCRPIIVSEESGDETDTSKSANSKVPGKGKDKGEQHPIQIQQWLQQILAETETEPIIHEIGQFSKIPNTHLYHEFPLET